MTAKTNEANEKRFSLSVWVPIWLAIVTAVASGGAWLSEHYSRVHEQELQENRQLNGYLVTIMSDLDQTKGIYNDLKNEVRARVKKDYPWDGLLQVYVTNSELRPRLLPGLDRLVDRNADILNKLDLYEGEATILVPEFKLEAESYRQYAASYAQRWASIKTPDSTTPPPGNASPFPPKFVTKVAEERAKREKLISSLSGK